MIDLVSRDGESFARLAQLVRSGGRVASLLGAADVDSLAARGLSATNVNAQADPGVFERVVAAAADGRLRAHVTRVLSLEEAAQGLETLSGGARGKLCVSLVR